MRQTKINLFPSVYGIVIENHQYQWYPTFEIPNGKIGDVDYQYWNGEADTFFLQVL